MSILGSRSKRKSRTISGEKARIDEKVLRRFPQAERALVIGLWHATNELNVLSKLIILSSGSRARGAIELSGKALVSLVLIKIFAAKAFEAWELFKRSQQFPEFKEKYLADGGASKLLEAKDWLGRYFGKSNILRKVRDKFSSHYDYDVLAKAANNLGKLDSFIFLTMAQGNSIYWVAEELLLRSFLELGKPGDTLNEVYDNLLVDVTQVASHLNTLAQQISIIAIHHAGNRKPFNLALEHKVRARWADTVEVPYFIDFRRRTKPKKKV